MNDIVERLEFLIKPGACEADMSVIDSLEEALAEIKSLRAQLASLRQIAGAANVGQSFREMKDSDVLRKFVGEG